MYGALPPETRKQQARLFNEEDNEYDVMVASDAVGMGLNLNIRRIVFTTLAKNGPTGKRQISVSEIKQIAGGKNLMGNWKKGGERERGLFETRDMEGDKMGGGVHMLHRDGTLRGQHLLM